MFQKHRFGKDHVCKVFTVTLASPGSLWLSDWVPPSREVEDIKSGIWKWGRVEAEELEWWKLVCKFEGWAAYHSGGWGMAWRGHSPCRSPTVLQVPGTGNI